MRNIVLITKDETFYKSIELFINRSGTVSSWLYVTQDVEETRVKNAEIVVVDSGVDYVNSHGQKILMLENVRTNTPDTIYKFQKFESVLTEIRKKAGFRSEVAAEDCKVIAITSAVGGAGKSTFLKYASLCLNESAKTATIRLIGGMKHPQNLTLSDLCFDEEVEGLLSKPKEFEFSSSDGNFTLPGFSLPLDFHEADMVDVIEKLKKYAKRNGIRNILIELPQLFFMQTQRSVEASNFSVLLIDHKRCDGQGEPPHEYDLNPKQLICVNNRCGHTLPLSIPEFGSNLTYEGLSADKESPHYKYINDIVIELGLKDA
ncbi:MULTISPECIES: hypothetical protein [unclassified Fusibacter]|uniref:hypothetical protein n=1 Tax=unclassified Fusibacter TaxID=2624464 RepID=UPI0010106A1D|nr:MULTISPECIES: hypothetical protein [unclassified Fusibacter]MCK8060818.1 hypothetical protein [Fusibacter sp. A2]NPE23114.1 hypothetical protein [Fusibacter sp. A1]RXV59786.1 hypothetical protein DWB64_14880 [Fusibacter sp. A1]